MEIQYALWYALQAFERNFSGRTKPPEITCPVWPDPPPEAVQNILPQQFPHMPVAAAAEWGEEDEMDHFLNMVSDTELEDDFDDDLNMYGF